MLFVLSLYFWVEAIYFQVWKALHAILRVANGQMLHAVESADVNFNDIPWQKASTHISGYLDQNKRGFVFKWNITL